MFAKTQALMAAATQAKIAALETLRDALKQQVADVEQAIDIERKNADAAQRALIATNRIVTPPLLERGEEARAKLKAMAEGKDIAAGTQLAKQVVRRGPDGRPIMGDLEQRLAEALNAEPKPDAAAPAGV